MKRRSRVNKSFRLDPDTVEAIKLKAIEENENYSRALDLIVPRPDPILKIQPLFVHPYYYVRRI